jgi:hypothetical protein
MTQLLAHLFGDYILQSDWMAQNKTKRSWPAFVHALIYSLCFVPLCLVAAQQIPELVTPIAAGSTCPEATTSLFTCSRLMIATPLGYLPALGGHVIPAHNNHGYFGWLPWLVIFGTHFLIDRFRLARYVVWAKNWLGPRKFWYRSIAGGRPHWTDDLEYIQAHVGEIKADDYYIWYGATPPLWACPTGYPPTTPIWLSTWLLIIADNTLHLAINYAALKYL